MFKYWHLALTPQPIKSRYRNMIPWAIQRKNMRRKKTRKNKHMAIKTHTEFNNHLNGIVFWNSHSNSYVYLSHLMRLWYLSHRRPAKAQTSLPTRAVSPEPSPFTHIKYGSRRSVWPKNQASSPTGWLRMRDWRRSLRKTKSTKMISWAGPQGSYSQNYMK